MATAKIDRGVAYSPPAYLCPRPAAKSAAATLHESAVQCAAVAAPLLKERLTVPIEAPLRARGTFTQRPDIDLERDSRSAMDVEWSDP